MEESPNTIKEQPEWLKKILKELGFQDNLTEDIKKANHFGSIDNEIMSEAIVIVNDLAPKCFSPESMKNHIAKLYQKLILKKTITDPEKIKKEAYSFLLERL